MRPGMKIIVILVSIVLFWSGVFYFVSCSDQPEKRAVKVAELALKASVDNAESVKVKGISQPDSVFGREYVSMDEKMSLSVLMMKINEKVMKETNGLEDFDPEDKDMVELMERQMTTMSVLRSLVTFSVPDDKAKKPFNGWKVKIEFEAETTGGKSYRSEYWFILDKDARCVVKSFEIPLI